MLGTLPPAPPVDYQGVLNDIAKEVYQEYGKSNRLDTADPIRAALFAMNMGDMYTTQKGLDQGLVEANPMAQYMNKEPWDSIVPMALAVGQDQALKGMKNIDPKAQKWMGMAMMLLKGLVLGNNAYQLMKK